MQVCTKSVHHRCKNILRESLLTFSTARCYAERGYATVCRPSVCLSVCLSVTFRYRDHIGWNTSKIIYGWIA